MMQDLKIQGLVKGSEQAILFGQLHGVSSVLYLITSLCGLALVLLRVNPQFSTDALSMRKSLLK